MFRAVADLLAPVFAQYPVDVVSGEGVWLLTRGGERVLDLYGGHAVAALGYGHPGWTKARRRTGEELQLPEQRRADGRAQARGPAPDPLCRRSFRSRVLREQRRGGERERPEDGVPHQPEAHACRRARIQLPRPHGCRRRADLGRLRRSGMRCRARRST